uniref:Dual specificity phosphatase 16 n=1 Tax=Lepisosteus oculatus TaxID=7918 RepID=W5NIB1_LEPOC|nr:PREDICTED: dual specificity protein phosphatase 16 [Lepisosteus oculatus]XP_015208448.1 PREDICTED: dual specificity protein phosphatase 16 [Lepisosteus oculatus]XP_015208449.1 PREDICTED: dual specificity protein phosphatase 16 [Lepisosteus oculatus]XP_015208451.1 PREDICTED: dual specificity protein phosphatase 16 [Lepisosteus oculatus]
MSEQRSGVRDMGAESLVALLEGGADKVLLIDSRPFVEYNTSHILEAVNINSSKLMKRRLQQDKVLITELIQHSAKKKLEVDSSQEVVVYDQSSANMASLSSEAFLTVLLAKLEKSFHSVHLLTGGFAEFSHYFPGLCEGKSVLVPSCISQPCLPVANVGPTRILPHLYLGCQRDVLNKDLMQQNDIAYVLNASNTCPKPDFIPESHFLRVPVNDSFCEKILPWLDKSVEFIEKAKASNARVLVHCLAGISRSATIAIAYIMKRMDMSLDEAYRFVKEKRPTISPNFNFLGQLLDFEKKIKNPLGPVGTITKLKFVHLDKASDSLSGQESGSSCGSSGTPLSCAFSTESTDQSLKEPLTLTCSFAESLGFSSTEERLLAQGLNGLHLRTETVEDSSKLKRSFSLDIKSYGAGSNGALRSFASTEENLEYYKPSAFKEASKPCQFSPVEEVSEQTTPERSPDKEQAGSLDQSSSSSSRQPSLSKPSPRSHLHPLHRSGSMEDNCKTTNFLFGLSSSQQHLAQPGSGVGLKGWHSDILAPVTATSLANSWYFSPESSRFYSTSAIFAGGGGPGYSAYSCGQLSGFEQAGCVRRRQKNGDRGDSRRSWHEESTFEKQFKRRSCQMEFEESMSESRSREELGKVGSQSSFSGSMEIIEVS